MKKIKLNFKHGSEEVSVKQVISPVLILKITSLEQRYMEKYTLLSYQFTPSSETDSTEDIKKLMGSSEAQLFLYYAQRPLPKEASLFDRAYLMFKWDIIVDVLKLILEPTQSQSSGINEDFGIEGGFWDLQDAIELEGLYKSFRSQIGFDVLRA